MVGVVPRRRCGRDRGDHRPDCARRVGLVGRDRRSGHRLLEAQPTGRPSRHRRSDRAGGAAARVGPVLLRFRHRRHADPDADRDVGMDSTTRVRPQTCAVDHRRCGRCCRGCIGGVRGQRPSCAQRGVVGLPGHAARTGASGGWRPAGRQCCARRSRRRPRNGQRCAGGCAVTAGAPRAWRGPESQHHCRPVQPCRSSGARHRGNARRGRPRPTACGRRCGRHRRTRSARGSADRTRGVSARTPRRALRRRITVAGRPAHQPPRQRTCASGPGGDASSGQPGGRSAGPGTVGFRR